MALLLVAPFYVVLAILFGGVDPILRQPVPVWNPYYWDFAQFDYVWQHIVGQDAFFRPALVRTVVYVGVSSLLCLLIAYPVAYYTARFAGRWKGLLLAALIAPFWISYMMRMLAWVNLLQTEGLVNKALSLGGLFEVHVNWLGGRPETVVMGLVYGYVPYMILPLFAGLDRIDANLLEAARDLGASRARTFWRVTLPLSKPAILAGLVIAALPMFGDYYTNDMLSGSPRTSMIGNLIDDAVGTPGQGGIGAVLVLMLMVILLIPMLYYIRSTAKATRERVV